jgi:hypothetical protein
MSDPGSKHRHYPYATIENSLDVELQPVSPNPVIQPSRRRIMIVFFFVAIFVSTLSLSLWRNFHFSLPLPDFPFKLSGSLSPSCALQRLLHAARYVFRS